MGRLAGVRAVVTGAGSGIGRAVVRRYLSEGARVVAVIRNPQQQADLEAEGAAVVIGDVAQHDTAARAVALAESAFGGLDTYVANAGLWDFNKRVERQTATDLAAAYQEIFGVNFLGALYGAHAALPALKASGGSVIVTGSNACFLAGGGGALYTASKFALRGLVLQLAKEFAPTVRVNGVAPGATRTPLSGPDALGQANRAMDADAARIAQIPHHVPLGRISEPEDHTDLYVMLAAKNESAYVTGTMMLSDGGLTISV
jgi:NAD(P)-dependent dehydrogenase (short-subunit alcohol dehydrogenase family)